jgi:hypothetical protein
MTRRTNTTTWRWLATMATIAAATFAMTAVTAAPAHALGAPIYTCTTAVDEPNFVGWATISHRGCLEPGAPRTMECRASAAYRWTGAAWQKQSLSECGGPRQVYVYPYAAGWSWIWSQQTGWLAVQSSLVQIRGGYGGCGLCMGY